MKPFNVKLSLVFLLVSFIAVNITAQEKEKESRKYLGIGLSTPLLQIHEMELDVVPGNRYLVAYDPIEYLRTELHCAFYKRDHMQNVAMYTIEKDLKLSLKEDSKLFGGGLFGVYPTGKFKFTAGCRFSKDKYDFDEIEYEEAGPKVVTHHGSVNIFSGVIGGEYYFNKWFSLGTEFSTMQMKNKVYTSNPGISETVTQKGIFEMGLALVFYPF